MHHTHPCHHCGEPIDPDEIIFARSRRQDGYFCDVCEFYHYFDQTRTRPRYTLYLEEKSNKEDVLVKTNKLKFKKRLSPLRYPGGKSKLIDFVGEQIHPAQLKTLISPFTGGASVELALFDSDLTDTLILNDKDPDVYNFWTVAFKHSDALIDYIQTHPVTPSLYEKAHAYMLGEHRNIKSNIERAFLFLVNNRCSFSGIYNAGRMGGRNGTQDQLTARYTPNTLIKQLKHLGELNRAKTVRIYNYSYEDLIERYMWESQTTFFIDPPYITKQASSIYKHSFNDDNHHYLFTFLNSIWHSYPNSDLLVFYDNHDRINDFALPKDVTVINRQYSIQNK